VHAAQVKDAGDTERKKLELESLERRDAAERDSNARASELAAQAEGLEQMVEKHLGELREQMNVIRDDRNNQAKAFIVELQGQNAESLARLQAFLEAQLAMLPDLTQQVGVLDQRTGQISTDVEQRLQELEQRRVQDQQTIVGLLNELKQTASQPWWQRRSSPGATE
jgi:hypothetical protein